MKLAVFGLTISSSWGNGHATLWRGLCRALARAGHQVVFFERDRSWYASARDWTGEPGIELVVYADWKDAIGRARADVASADAAIVTSYCADALAARDLVLDQGTALPVFYDLDTPVTLERLDAGAPVPYLDARGLRDYALALSYTGGGALDALREQLGARLVRPLYGHVDPDLHRPVPADRRFRADLSWLGTYADDRQHALERLFLQAADRCPERRFLVAGAQYPPDFPWRPNVWFVHHLPPGDHAAFLCSSRLTLNVTRAAMAACGWCPSGRLFEAAACGATVLTDCWPGLEAFYQPGEELLTTRSATDTVAALQHDDAALAAIGRAARERTLAQHTSAHRAADLLDALEDALRAGQAAPVAASAARAATAARA
jgi:spore maturation protein CgeB